ncbi:MAG TPA: DUF6249 domain-containing protein [Anaeromyxobacter sp.]|nr:DUF6249 domain-containing protein [Anaeromyxobacter sp.]
MNRAPLALLLALAPGLARADIDLENVLVPISVVGIVFGFTALMVGIVFYAVHRNSRLRHETIRIALEKGQPLPPNLLDPPSRRRDPVQKDLRSGLLLVAIGLGVGLFLLLAPFGEGQRAWAVGFIPLLMGFAYLAAYAVARREQQKVAGASPARE